MSFPLVALGFGLISLGVAILAYLATKPKKETNHYDR